MSSRGYYFVFGLDGRRCPHKHIELSRTLKRCQKIRGGQVHYTYDGASVRIIREDEEKELAGK